MVIEKVILIALSIWAVHAIFQEGMILGEFGEWLREWHEGAYKLLFGCPTCMGFWYGIPACMLLGISVWYILPIMGLNWIIGAFVD